MNEPPNQTIEREAYLESVIACYERMITHYEELTRKLSVELRRDVGQPPPRPSPQPPFKMGT